MKLKLEEFGMIVVAEYDEFGDKMLDMSVVVRDPEEFLSYLETAVSAEEYQKACAQEIGGELSGAFKALIIEAFDLEEDVSLHGTRVDGDVAEDRDDEETRDERARRLI